MVKKLALLCFLFVLISGSSVLAEDDAVFSTARFDGSSWIETSVFSLIQKPWLHIDFPLDITSSEWTVTQWNYLDGSGNSYFLGNIDSTDFQQVAVGNQDLYLSFDDASWASKAAVGDWNIGASAMLLVPAKYGLALKSYDNYAEGGTPFKITPEPVSSALFILGAGTLALRKWKRNKKG